MFDTGFFSTFRVFFNVDCSYPCYLKDILNIPYTVMRPCLVGSVGSVSASRTVGHEFASWPGHTKDHHKNGTNCLPAWHAMR